VLRGSILVGCKRKGFQGGRRHAPVDDDRTIDLPFGEFGAGGCSACPGIKGSADDAIDDLTGAAGCLVKPRAERSEEILMQASEFSPPVLPVLDGENETEQDAERGNQEIGFWGGAGGGTAAQEGGLLASDI